MSQSIEKIWKEGFINDEALIAPKLNNLYSQKSKHIVDRFERVFTWNLIGLVMFAVIAVIGMTIEGMPYLGLFIAAMLIALVVRGKEELAKLALIDKNVSSYHYLKSFDQWLNNQMRGYAKLYSFFYPALFLAIITQVRFTAFGDEFINGLLYDFPAMPLLFSIPLYLLMVIISLAILLYFLSGPLYRLDFNSLYGRMFNKLAELLNDMETLRK